MKRTSVALLLVGVVLAASVACTPRDVEQYVCLEDGRPVYDVPTDHLTPWPPSVLLLENGTAIDARGEEFDNSPLTPTGFGLGVKFHERPGSRDDLCMVGGTIGTSFDPEDTSWDTWHRITALTVEIDNFTVIGTRFVNQGDMIAFVGAQNWKVIGVRADGMGQLPGAYIHDDCIENDGMASGLIDDVKLDGCNTFLSSSSGANGTGNTVEVRNSLVRLQPYRNSFNVPKYGENKHGGFFKWSNPLQGLGIPPALTVSNSTFRADQRGSYSGNANGFLGLPPGTECDNVMLIGSEVWKPSDLASWQDQCTNLTYGTIADWDARTAEWDAAHPEL